MKIFLEIEIGITGGEEDGVDNSEVDNDKLYTSPEQVWNVYQGLSPISDMFSIAAAFGNVHGVVRLVSHFAYTALYLSKLRRLALSLLLIPPPNRKYKPGNVKLAPERLAKHQHYAKAQLGDACDTDKPIFLVMHGGSGSTDEEIHAAVDAGTIKMNVDTDTQWAYWDGVRKFVAANHDYLQGQIGNPKAEDAPNKKYYDPRVWIRKAEESMAERSGLAMVMLRSAGTFPVKKPESPPAMLTGLLF